MQGGMGNHPSCVAESVGGVEGKLIVAHTCLSALFS